MKRKIKIYATCFWQNDISLLETLKAYGFGKARWRNIEFTFESDYDIVVILTAPYDKSKIFNKDSTIVFLTEPPESPHCSPHSEYFVHPMYLVSSFGYEMRFKNNINFSTEKTKLFSSVTSELSWLKGHRKRLEFIYYLDEVIADGFDLFGRQYTGNYFKMITAYRGEIENKFDALLPYEYHFACENSFIPNYFTEKIVDPIIAECLCFYDGCSNIHEFIDERAFVKLNIDDTQDSIERIIKAIQDDEYNKRKAYILQQKERLLTELNPLNIIWAAVNGKDTLNYFKLK